MQIIYLPSDFVVFSLTATTEKQSKTKPNPLKTYLLAVVVAFSVVFCAKQVFTVPNTDISYLFKVFYLPVKRSIGTFSWFRAFLQCTLQASSWFRFLFLIQVCFLGAKTLAFTLPHCVCFVIFWFCWCSDTFSVKGGLQAHHPAWQELRATRISWGETSRCSVWDFSSPNYINYIISLKKTF